VKRVLTGAGLFAAGWLFAQRVSARVNLERDGSKRVVHLHVFRPHHHCTHDHGDPRVI